MQEYMLLCSSSNLALPRYHEKLREYVPWHILLRVGDEVTVYADTRAKLGNKWHCTVYATPQTITEHEFTICGIGETQEQAYSNAQQTLTIATLQMEKLMFL